MAGSGMAGSGMAGSGMAGSGMAGSGMAGSGMAGNGMAGNGVAGSGMAGNGSSTNGSSTNGSSANGQSRVNGRPLGETADARRVLRVLVPRDGGEAACLRVLEQLHGLVERNPGEDALELVLRDRTGARVELRGARIQVRHSPELESQVRVLVGSDNVSRGRSDASQPGT
jgi:hypothetical protein